MHGGRVAAHSDGLGHGSEFVVHLPLLREVRRLDQVGVEPCILGAAAVLLPAVARQGY